MARCCKAYGVCFLWYRSWRNNTKNLDFDSLFLLIELQRKISTVFLSRTSYNCECFPLLCSLQLFFIYFQSSKWLSFLLSRIFFPESSPIIKNINIKFSPRASVCSFGIWIIWHLHDYSVWLKDGSCLHDKKCLSDTTRRMNSSSVSERRLWNSFPPIKGRRLFCISCFRRLKLLPEKCPEGHFFRENKILTTGNR